MNFHPRVYIIAGFIFMVMGFVINLYISGSEDLKSPEPQSAQPLQQSLITDIIGNHRPVFSLNDINGQIRSIEEWDGKVILINFWATWCLPCLKEIPELLALQRHYGDSGFQVIGIALQKAEELTEFVSKHNMTYPILAGEAEVIVIAESYGNQIGALPYSVIIDRSGTVAFTKAGPVTEDEVAKLLDDLLL